MVVRKFDHPDLRTSKQKFIYAQHIKYVVHKYGAETRDTELCRILREVERKKVNQIEMIGNNCF
jgi:hypothetical protein